MALVLKSPVAPSNLDKRWSPPAFAESTFVDSSCCPSLALNSPVSTMTTDSLSSAYLPSTSEDPQPLSTVVAHDMQSSGWYSSGIPASTYEFSFDNTYITPSLGPFSPPEYSKAEGLPHIDTSKVAESAYNFGSSYDSTLPPRPRSSPSTFSPTSGPRIEDFLWQQQSNGLGISHQSSPPMDPLHNYPYGPRTPRHHTEPAIPSVNDINAPQPRRTYIPLAPNPSQQAQSQSSKKRHRDSEEPHDSPNKRRIRSDSATVTQELTEEDKLLLKLKDEESLPWKDIAMRFQTDLGKTCQIPALQMRLKRLRERLRVWTNADVQALHLAHDYWIQSKYEIIASKMIEYGASDRWSARQCARKWADIDPGPTPYTTTTTSSYESPMPQYATSPPTDAHAFLPYMHIQQ
ncbi:hypothetical protein EJ05DRAFT_540184 [Pseudovirgaria hyperparasitica]|uniref:Myb-like domain-containing protein n=1 Tax=Pseudovirgaria hyperparasitica TaxID=470096 RepID=A0A6A6VXW1_9PEZI|nr:uncharacterized protein EJ05DRAFT_540184 [Pseudovirgaria hyperparasitica]KAF2755452.1 hypothetical protein EJ05DRAFT_540184 [Pseudovirgaria hyperparasitica]